MRLLEYLGDVVTVDVVTGDDVGVLFLYDLREPPYDVFLAAFDHLAVPDLALVPHDVADGEDVPIGDGVLQVEGQYLQVWGERFDLLEMVHVQDQVGGVLALAGGPEGPDAGAHVLVVDETVMEGYVRRQHLEVLPFDAITESGYAPRIPYCDLGGMAQLALVIKI